MPAWSTTVAQPSAATPMGGWTTVAPAQTAPVAEPAAPAPATPAPAQAKPERTRHPKGARADLRPEKPESVAGSVAPSVTPSAAPSATPSATQSHRRFKSPKNTQSAAAPAAAAPATAAPAAPAKFYRRGRSMYCDKCKTLNEIIQRQCQADHVHHRVSFEYVDTKTGNVYSTNFGNVLPCSLLTKFDAGEVTCGVRMPTLCADGDKCRFLFSTQPCFGVHLARTDDPSEPKLITLVREAPKNIHIKIEWINKTAGTVQKTNERYILCERSTKDVDVYFRGLGPRIPNFEDELIVAFDTTVRGLEQPEGTTHLRITRIRPQ